MKMTDSNKRRKQAICIASLLSLLSFLLLIHLGYEYKGSVAKNSKKYVNL